MGQRHQAFAIARVRPHSADPSTPPKYRCIAAFHHQWCYGRLPLHATHRFITQIKQKDNAEIIRAEIASIQGKFGRWRGKPKLPRLPCPFTAFLLATNWSVNLEDPDEPYASGVSFNNAALHADMGSGEGDNNDGISIIDVTDPMAPSYCFVSFDGIEAEGELPSRVPLSAEDYARAYYPKYTLPAQNEAAETEEEAKRRRNSLSVEEDVQATIAKLKDVKLVSQEMLSEAWPAEYEMAVDKKEATDAGTETDTSALLSLADMTMALAVTQAVQGGDTTDIEAMVWMPGKASLVKTTLRELSPFPDTGMVLLAKAIEKELETDKTQLDLSGFTLSSTQLESLISSMEGIETVNLSHTSTTTINDVRVILAKFTQLKRLALVDCPSVLSEDIHKLLDAEPQLFSHLEALIHPYFLGALKDASDTSPYRNAFSYIGVYTHSLKACSLPFFTPSRVIHALIDTLQPLGEPYHTYSFLQTSLAMQAAFASMREPGQKWSERRTVVIPQFSLRALKGEGWAFAITFGMFAVDGEGNGYAFLRFKHPSETVSEKKEAGVEASDAAAGPTDAPEMTWEIHDLASFINQVTLDGSARPTDEAVNKLQEILSILQMTQNMQLMGDEGVKKWLSSVKMLIQHLY